MLERLFSWLARAETRHQLNTLSDQQLNDIGLSRDQIDDVAREMSERAALARDARWTGLPSFQRRRATLDGVMRGA